MSQEKIERILATYKPVEELPGYVWVDNWSIVKIETLRKAYEEFCEDKDEKNRY